MVSDGSNLSQPFAIDPLTGTISTTALLDRENITAYSLIVRATDGAAGLHKRFFCSIILPIVRSQAFKEFLMYFLNVMNTFKKVPL